MCICSIHITHLILYHIYIFNAAPEVILNQGHDVAVDYWTIGIFITEMVSLPSVPYPHHISLK